MIAGASESRWFVQMVPTICCLFLVSLQWGSGSVTINGATPPTFAVAFVPQPAFTTCSTSLSHPVSSQNSDRGHHHRDVLRLSESISSSSSPNSSNKRDTDSSNGNRSFKSFLSVLWRFTRPHTIIGSALAIPALHILAAPSYADALTVRSICSIVYATIPGLLMNLYITGLNQITDVEIDKINKPNLPIASGELSVRDATITVVLSLVVSVVLGVAGSPAFATEGLNMALGMSALLGTLYSLPPFRLKRFPLLAAFCIVLVRGAVINAGFFAHARVAAYGAVSSTTVLQCLWKDPRCYLSSLYFAVFGFVIALMKDVPDIKGDELSNIRTVSVRLGAKTVYRTMHRLLTGLFWGAGIAFFRGAIVTTKNISNTATVAVRLGRAVVGIAALLAGASVQREAAPVDPENPNEVYDFYMHLWKLFYLSYFVLPLAR